MLVRKFSKQAEKPKKYLRYKFTMKEHDQDLYAIFIDQSLYKKRVATARTRSLRPVPARADDPRDPVATSSPGRPPGTAPARAAA